MTITDAQVAGMAARLTVEDVRISQVREALVAAEQALEEGLAPIFVIAAVAVKLFPQFASLSREERGPLMVEAFNGLVGAGPLNGRPLLNLRVEDRTFKGKKRKR